jgi:hypothetical protein
VSNEDASADRPLKRRDLPRRKFPKSAVIFGVLGFLSGAVLNPVLAKAVDRYIPGLFQGLDDSLGSSSLIAAESSWPWVACGQVTAGVMPGGPSPQEFLASAQGLNPFVLTQSGVTVPWNLAQLKLLLTARQPTDTLLVQNIRPRVYKHIQGDAQWTTTPPGSACGGADQRNYEVALQSGEGVAVDKGVIKGVGDGPLAPTIPNGFAGSAFTVAQNDAAEVTLSVFPKDGYYEFGFDITYVLNGHSEVKTVGTPEEPYKAGGGGTLKSFSVDYDGKPVS